MTAWIFPPSTDDDRPQPHDVLSVSVEMHDAHTVVHLDGPVCAYTAPHLDTELRLLEDTGRTRLVIDAGGVGALCTAGVDVLLAHEQRCAERGGDLVIRDLRAGARRVLDVLSLDRLAVAATAS